MYYKKESRTCIEDRERYRVLDFFIYYFIDYGIIKDVTERYNYNREVTL